MAFSRFYQPVQTQYISQFVPENLELFDAALGNRQKEYDQTAGQIDLINDALLKQEALPEHDARKLEEIKGGLQTFTSEMQGLDLSLPENKRKIFNYIRQLSDNEDLKKIQKAVDVKKAHDKNVSTLKSKAEYQDYNDLMIDPLNQYLKQKGDDQKFAIDFIEGYQDVEKDEPAAPYLKEMINSVKADGYTYDTVKGIWKHRDSNEEVSFEKVMKLMNLNMPSFKETVPGKQMERRAAKNGITFEQQFQLESIPVAAEQVYKKTSNTMTDNSAQVDRIMKWKKEEEEAKKVHALTQKGVTAELFIGHDSMDSYNDEIKRLYQSDKPEDHRKAGQMEAQRDALNEKFSRTLTKKESDLLTYTVEDAKNEWKNSKNTNQPRIFNLWDEAKENVEKQKKIEKAQAGAAWGGTPIPNDEEILEEYKKLKGEEQNIDYYKLKKERDKYISKGEIFESKDIIQLPGTDGDKIRKSIANMAVTAFNDINYDIKHSSNKDVTLDEAAKTIEPHSVKATIGAFGPEISFSYITKDDDGKNKSENMVITSKDLGDRPSEASDVIYKTLAGNDPQLYDELYESHIYSNLQPISENSSYNQHNDIARYLPLDVQEKLKDYPNLKIVRDGNEVRLKGKYKPKNTRSQPGQPQLLLDGDEQIDLKASSVAELIDIIELNLREFK